MRIYMDGGVAGHRIVALEDVTSQKEQLLLLNAELAETNRGVVALYSELSEELEQTNRGVVALDRELDEKSEQLRAASESKDRFWANVSHELRTPLNSIIGLTRLDGHTLLDRLPATVPAIVITGLDVAKPRRAAALLLKDDLTRERLAFAIGRITQVRR